MTYVHQSVPFQDTKSFSFFNKNEFRLACIQYILGFIIKKAIMNSELNIVQTKWMKNAVEKACNVNNVKQIYPNMPEVKKKATYETTKIFFYPTSKALYKNNELLVNVTNRLLDDGMDIKTIITTEGKTKGIEYVGRIPIKKVYEYYSSSCVFFPSYIETFGYPLVEARSAGAIVLASDCEFSHELLDGYDNAYFFNPFDETELVNLMRKVAIGIITRKKQKNEGDVGNVAIKNTWDEVIDQILKVAMEK